MKRYVSLVALVILLAGCGDESAYVGQWVSETNQCATIRIEKSENGYLVNLATPGVFGLEERTFPGEIKGNKLYMEAKGGKTQLFIKKETNTLVTPIGEYHRHNDADKGCRP